MKSASIEVASNGYIITYLDDGYPTTKSVYTNIIEALEQVTRHICFEFDKVEIRERAGMGK